MEPKGKLIIIGGHEDKIIDGENLIIGKRSYQRPYIEILDALISKEPGSHHLIEIITTASTLPAQIEEMYREAYKTAKFYYIGFIHIERPEDGENPSYIQRVNYCSTVFFTGGDQLRLTSILNGSKILEVIKRKYHEDKAFVVAGTSAGAMAIPKTIITGGIIKEALMKGDIKTGGGLEFHSGIIVDTHFIKRGRFARLAHAVALNPSLLGIGLGEDTALCITHGNQAECMGSGMAILIDGNEINNTNVHSADNETPIIIENLKVHILAEGSKFDLDKRKFI
ncbi:MAG: cyanophycinase [Bacteroidetes bacterium]|nr:cyanophycinase [Bacteroidota bacterium]